MYYLNDKKKELKTPLKFDCPRCRKPVVSNFLRIGEQFNCPHCKEVITVPVTALKTSEDSNVLDIWKTGKIAPIPEPKPTLAAKIKKKYEKIDLIIGLIVATVVGFVLKDFIRNDYFRMFLVSAITFLLVSSTISSFRKQEKESTPKSELDKELE
ncbi:MAG: hypothetical protein JSW64_05345 [Candidatus Zixiibacteriota bacterium]|nr:MAG: hypothetical protein JSW64_05345 [candidate division Zixibacteria bacterium]